MTSHHPDCPVRFFVDHPERCPCEFMVAIDQMQPPCGERCPGECGWDPTDPEDPCA